MSDEHPPDVPDLVVRATSGVILRDDDGRVVLIRRAHEDTWGIPGGGLSRASRGPTTDSATTRW